MDRNQIGSFSSSDLIDAKLEERQLCRSMQCPGCGYKLERKAVWLGLPAGVKFDPTDQELIEHLDAKVGCQDLKSHPLIDEFIPTIVGEDGICYTHPERLPGVTRDGLSKHFFHRPSKAYTTGTRKRRKIQNECDLQGGETRWHKTGKTRPVMVNGKQKGCKKILVLYTNFGRNRKPEKTNWVMHQYHLGQLEEEKDGDLVVSKIFYQTQPRQCNWSERGVGTSERMGTRRDSGSGSCSSKDLDSIRDEVSEGGAAGMAAVSSHNVTDYQHLNYDHFSFSPFRKSFDEVGEEEHTAGRDASPCAYQEHEGHGHKMKHHLSHEHHLQYKYDQVTAETYMHVSKAAHPISTIIPPLDHASGVSHEDSYHISRIIIQNERFQQEQQHHMLSGPGLEEMLMGCTSTDHRKDESSITNTQEAEWLKYSFWPEPDDPYHHG